MDKQFLSRDGWRLSGTGSCTSLPLMMDNISSKTLATTSIWSHGSWVADNADFNLRENDQAWHAPSFLHFRSQGIPRGYCRRSTEAQERHMSKHRERRKSQRPSSRPSYKSAEAASARKAAQLGTPHKMVPMNGCVLVLTKRMRCALPQPHTTATAGPPCIPLRRPRGFSAALFGCFWV
eukprot:298470-Amphidinium_carterae.2